MNARFSAAKKAAIAGSAAAALIMTGCSAEGGGEVIQISGSATVAPITQAVATQGRFEVEIAAEGTNSGFDRFCRGETAINNASAPIPGAGAETDYTALCAEHGVEYLELPIGLDALSIVRNEANGLVEDLTLEQLQAIWEPGSEVSAWSDLDPSWPDEPIGLYGRGDGSGTYDVFTQAVNGETGAIREDYSSTDDLDELAAWVAEDEYGIGFMGVGNYLAADEEYRNRITNVSVDGAAPGLEEVQSGEYDALTRPLFLYVAVNALDDERVASFVEYYLNEAREVLPRVYFYALPEEAYPLVQSRYEDRIPGTMYGEGGEPGASVVELLGGV
ncbi:substrate-binding domain-containing protein [Gulosibacter sp. 10]|uniref:substrate-binding domain-containing protein n=1 Tax=Gulosibacter sp. 10 TaxID=1255570 RepID=UPI00097E8366|nr:substrate-binding domain-containing protein [Gulosibacter sp. 10]SJM71249.1 Phosphate ABC transporter, periplasmic phosphate-binding protein PstS (TC 3.A.1.7.1) [Gulosibacter sp. 10]